MHGWVARCAMAECVLAEGAAEAVDGLIDVADRRHHRPASLRPASLRELLQELLLCTARVLRLVE